MVRATPAQVFYPVEKSCVEKLPWFPSSIEHFRRSLVPAIAEARRAPFTLTLVSAHEAEFRLWIHTSTAKPDLPPHSRLGLGA